MGDRDDRNKDADGRRKPDEGKPANTAPDAVKDPSEKTEGKPGVPGGQGKETDPGAG